MFYLKKNKITFFTLAILICFAIISAFNVDREFKMRVLSYKTTILRCDSELKGDSSFDDMCREYKNWGGPRRSDSSAPLIFLDIVQDNVFMSLQIILPFLILMCSIFNLNKKIKSGWIKNELTRKKYNRFIFFEWLDSVKQLWIIPFVFIFVFFLSYCMTGNLNYHNSYIGALDRINILQDYYLPFFSDFFRNYPFSLFIYFINFILQGIFIINLGYIMTRKTGNYIVSVISAFIIYNCIWIILEFIPSMIGKQELRDYFSFSSIWIHTNWIVFFIQLFFAAFSSLFVYLLYKNKEEVLSLNE